MASVTERQDLLSAVRDSLSLQRETDPDNTYVRSQGNLGFVRIPFTMTCKSWQKQQRYIVFNANPVEAGWDLAQRSSEEKTRLGTILHLWKDNARNTYYDEPILDFTFQAGSIFPIKINENKQWSISHGLNTFYEFLELVDEQKMVSDPNDANYGIANMINIMYTSTMFPVIILTGLFSPAGTQWTDGSEDPYNLIWRARFTVRKTFPKLGCGNTLGMRNTQLRDTFNQAVKNMPIRNPASKDRISSMDKQDMLRRTLANLITENTAFNQ